MALRVQAGRADELIEALLAEAEELGLYAIVRLQDLRRKQVVMAGGKTEDTRALFSRGFGFHLFDADGHTAFGCADGWDVAEGLEALRRAGRAVESARHAASERNRDVFEVSSVRDVVDPSTAYPFDHRPLRDLAGDALALHLEVRGLGEDLRVRSLYAATREEWRIARSDGTDVAFSIPRSFYSSSITAGSGSDTASATSSLFGTSHEILLDDQERVLARARHSVDTLRRVLVADPFPGGSHPIVMDHSLAKVLAHEAFGHAAESDAYRSSVLARDGVFRRGEEVAASEVSLVDESIEGDHAYQPYSSNGLRREPAVIIRDGRLDMGLADLFSARAGGVPMTGAARAESYRSVPLPRMSNIRIELDDPAPLELDAEEELTPEMVRDVLVREGFLNDARPRIIYLKAFRGGQVNPARGDFVFNCQALYEITRDGVRDHRPAIFSGSVMEALKAIRGAVGGLRLDAMGTCGKRGQGVPSCGGSHRLLFLESSPQIGLGGGGS